MLSPMRHFTWCLILLCAGLTVPAPSAMSSTLKSTVAASESSQGDRRMSPEEAVSFMAENLNRTLPQHHNLPDGTSMTFRMASASGRVLTHHFDFNNFTFDERSMDMSQLREVLQRTAFSQVCMTMDQQSIARIAANGIQYGYTYRDQTGRHLATFLVNPADC